MKIFIVTDKHILAGGNWLFELLEVLVCKYDQLVGHFQTEVGDMYHSNWMFLYRGDTLELNEKMNV